MSISDEVYGQDALQCYVPNVLVFKLGAFNRES